MGNVQLRPRSHIACNRSATSLRPKFSSGRREVAGRLQGDRRLVGDRLQAVAGTIWSQGAFGCCKWNLPATNRRPVAAVADNPDTVFSCRLIADQSPIGCRPIFKMLQTFCNHKQTLKIQSPTSCRPIADRLPIAPQLIADWLPTDHRRVGNHCPITRQYSINTRSLSAPEPMLDLFFSKFQWH